MFKIEYERANGSTDWLHTMYDNPEDADTLAKRLIQAADRGLVRTTVIEQAGNVYSQHVDYRGRAE